MNPRLAVCPILLGIFGLLGGLAPAPVKAAPAPLAGVSWRFVPSSGTALSALSAGVPGTGTLLYFGAHRSHDRPLLAVRLRHQAGQPAVATVFSPPPGRDWVPITNHGGVVAPDGWVKPSLAITALGGWWVRHGITNFNLSVSVFGAIGALWDGPPVGALRYGRPAVQIEIRSQRGTPVWDLRRLIPTFPGKGYVRANYAQRECLAPLVYGSSPVAMWPYVAGPVMAARFGKPVALASSSPGYLQRPGHLRPPIFVDWSTGRILSFSEVVSVRAQSCGYDLYSLRGLASKPNPQPVDFESPWGFYDLSQSRNGFPNLIINMTHYPVGDPWVASVGPGASFVPAPTRPLDNVRYSWADHPGNGRFDYKVDVFGNVPYPQSVALAGGSVKVWAPAYGRYPGWVIRQRWPSATFVDATYDSYSTSEGIYQWASWLLNDPRYWAGVNSNPDLAAFGTISKGLRGEFRMGAAEPVKLYVSPIDGRLHLLFAQGGTWNLGRGRFLMERNLTGGPAIDDWRRVRPTRRGPEIAAEVAALGGFLLYSGPAGVVVRRLAEPATSLAIAPPTSRASWLTFRTAVGPSRTGRDQWDMSSWLSAGAAAGQLSFPGARFSNLRRWGSGFKLVLHAHAGVTLGASAAGLPPRLTPGTYVVTYRPSTGWTIHPARGPKVDATLMIARSVRPGGKRRIVLVVRNHGDIGWRGPVKWRLMDSVGYRALVSLDGSQTREITVKNGNLPTGTVTAMVRVGRRQPAPHAIAVPVVARPSEWSLAGLGLGAEGQLPAVGLLALVIAAGAAILGWRLAGRRP